MPGGFYLGTHVIGWLGRVDVPLFLSFRRLRSRKRPLPRAAAPWALDSGGFTELADHGRWTISADEYADAILRFADQAGQLAWAAPQDWMTEPFILRATGLTVAHHQDRTIASYLDLRDRGLPVVPVLQGWSDDDYHRHVDDYAAAGVDLTSQPIVGIGSVCRRQNSAEIARIVGGVAHRGIALHGFGVKIGGLTRYARALASADSMSWSFDARNADPLPDCTHKSCANCKEYAMRWRASLLERLAERDAATDHWLPLFDPDVRAA